MDPLFIGLLGLTNDDVRTIGAGATTVGVLIALIGPAARRWWRAPLLSLEYEPEDGGPHWDHVKIADGAFYLRARVRNARGCSAAKNVQAIVSGYQAGDLGLDSRALEWSGQQEKGRLPVTSLVVPPGVERPVDIVKISLCKGPDARLCVYPKPWGGGDQVQGRDSLYEFMLTLAATNADAVSYRMLLKYPGGQTACLCPRPKRLGPRRTVTAVRRHCKRLLHGGER